MKIAIYSRHGSQQQAESVLSLMKTLQCKEGVEVFLYEPFFSSLSKEEQRLHTDLTLFNSAATLPYDIVCLMSVGGDGTFLDAAALVAHADIPMVGVSTGRLGFLASIPINKSAEAIEDIYAGKFTIEHRNLIKVEGCPDGTHYALNEVCLQKRGAAIAEINVHINGEFLNNYWADGLIVATPTGSTAYSLSAGGPIVSPDASCFIVSPIAPHNLSVRPIVIPDSVMIELEMFTRSGNIIVGIDGKSFELPVGAQLKVQKADAKIGFIKLGNTSFYNTLRDKLKWGLDARG